MSTSTFTTSKLNIQQQQRYQLKLLCPFTLQKFTHILILVLVINQAEMSHGGMCWLSMNRNGLCSAVIKTGASKEECCNSKEPYSNSVSLSWSEEDLSSSSFFLVHLQGGAQCSRCKETCDAVKCPPNQKCVIRNGLPKCVCAPNCAAFRLQNGSSHRKDKVVCGSDGRTYKSTCRLLKRACRRKVKITIAYYGACKQSCLNLSCPSKKRCLLDQNMIPHCVNCSQRKCSSSSGKGADPSKRVCGADGIEYPTICDLRQAACHKGKAIPMAYKGPCKKKATCSSVQCGEGQSCLVELPTGKPRCVTCTQPKWCRKSDRSQMEGPICATNGQTTQTYRSWCEMNEISCVTGVALDTKHFGKCKRDNLK